MILCDIKNISRFSPLSPGLTTAIDWLSKHASDTFTPGQTALEEDPAIIVKCEEPHLLPREKAVLEAHQKFIDIHVPLKDVETIGYASVSSLKYPHGPYDAERDVTFFGDSATSLLHVRVGQAAIFFPEDAHAPNIGNGKHRKLCIKIPV